MKPTLDAQIAARIESFLAELSTLVKSAALDAVHTALGAPSASRAPAGAPTRRRGRPAKNDSGAADALMAHIKANPGQRIDEIAKAMGAKSKDLSAMAKKLFDAKLVKRKGQRRGTRYYAG